MVGVGVFFFWRVVFYICGVELAFVRVLVSLFVGVCTCVLGGVRRAFSCVVCNCKIVGNENVSFIGERTSWGNVTCNYVNVFINGSFLYKKVNCEKMYFERR